MVAAFDPLTFQATAFAVNGPAAINTMGGGPGYWPQQRSYGYDHEETRRQEAHDRQARTEAGEERHQEGGEGYGQGTEGQAGGEETASQAQVTRQSNRRREQGTSFAELLEKMAAKPVALVRPSDGESLARMRLRRDDAEIAQLIAMLH